MQQIEDAFISIHPSTDSISGDSAIVRSLFQDVFNNISSSTSINFVPAANYQDAELRIGLMKEGVMPLKGEVANADIPHRNGSQLALNSNYIKKSIAKPDKANSLKDTIIHEVLHTLGLDHPFEGSNVSQDLNDVRSTIMAYTKDPKKFPLTGYLTGLTPSPIDIAALSEEYGAPNNLPTGGTFQLSSDTNINGTIKKVGYYSYYTISTNNGTLTVDDRDKLGALLNLNSTPIEKAFNEPWKSTWDNQLYFLRKMGAQEILEGFNFFVDMGLSSPWEHLKDARKYHSGIYSHLINPAYTGGFAISPYATVNTAIGGVGNDILIGNTNDNILDASDGDNIVSGGEGADTITTGIGKNKVAGGPGNDRLVGNSNGTNTAYYKDICANYSVTELTNGSFRVEHISGSLEDGTDILSDYDALQFKDSKIDLNNKDADGDIKSCRNNKLDVVFVLDFSKSFSDDLPALAQSANTITNTILQDNPLAKFAIASFLDYPFEPFGSPGEWLYKPEMKLGSAIKFSDTLSLYASMSSNWPIGIEGDAREAQWYALYQAAKGVGLNLRKKSNKLIILATDSPAHTAETYGLTSAEVVNELQRAYLNQDQKDDLQLSGDGHEVPPKTFFEMNYDRITSGNTRDPLVSAFDDKSDETTSTTGLIVVSPYESLSNKYAEQYNNRSSNAIFENFSLGDGFSENARYTGAADVISYGYSRIFGGLDENSTGIGDSSKNKLNARPNGPRELWGLADEDTLNGSQLGDTLHGGSGDDIIKGKGGNDLIYGGSGDDIIDGGSGDDKIYPGVSTASFISSDTVRTGSGSDIVAGTLYELDYTFFSDFHFRKDKLLVSNVQKKKHLDIRQTEITVTRDSLSYSMVTLENTNTSDLSQLYFVGDLDALEFGIQKAGRHLFEVTLA